MRARPVPTYVPSSRAFPGAGVARHRVQTCGVTVIAGSDQNGTDRKLLSLTKSANLLVMHLTVAVTARSGKRHASQARHLAQEAGARGLILNHIEQFDLDDAVAKVISPVPAHSPSVPISNACKFTEFCKEGDHRTLSTCAQTWPGSTKAGINPKAGIIASPVVSRVMSIHTALRSVRTWEPDCCDA